jgi:hypothetical protein
VYQSFPYLPVRVKHLLVQAEHSEDRKPRRPCSPVALRQAPSHTARLRPVTHAFIELIWHNARLKRHALRTGTTSGSLPLPARRENPARCEQPPAGRLPAAGGTFTANRCRYVADLSWTTSQWRGVRPPLYVSRPPGFTCLFKPRCSQRMYVICTKIANIDTSL